MQIFLLISIFQSVNFYLVCFKMTTENLKRQESEKNIASLPFQYYSEAHVEEQKMPETDCQKYQLDVTDLVNQVKEQDLMLFPALLYLLTLAVNAHNDKVCHPVYPVILDTGTVVFTSLLHETDFASFYLNYLKSWLACHNVAGSSSQGLPVGAESFQVSFLPEEQLPETDVSGMLVLLGKLAEKEGKAVLPLSVLRFEKDFAPVFEQTQKLCHDCRSWLKHP